MTTYGTTSDDNDVSFTTFCFQWLSNKIRLQTPFVQAVILCLCNSNEDRAPGCTNYNDMQGLDLKIGLQGSGSSNGQGDIPL